MLGLKKKNKGNAKVTKHVVSTVSLPKTFDVAHVTLRAHWSRVICQIQRSLEVVASL